MTTRKSNSHLDLMLLLILAIGLRFFSFFQSSIEHDESTYMVIARDLFNNKDLYTDITDTKPIGIFLLMGLIQKITGDSIFWLRFMVSLLVGFTGYWLYCFQLNWLKNRKAALASGIIYIFFVSTWKAYGISCNSELFFAFFNALALLFLFRSECRYRFALSGFVFGISFIVKYSAVFDFAAIMLFVFIGRLYRKDGIKSVFTDAFTTLIMFLVPFGLVHLYFWFNGNFKDFLFITYKVAGNYRDNVNYYKILERLIDFHALFIPIWIFFYYMIIIKNSVLNRSYKLLILTWIVFVGLSILQLGNDFPHYFLQFAMPVSLLAGVFFHEQVNRIPVIRFITRGPFSRIIMGLLVFVVFFAGKMEYYDKPDQPEVIAEYIEENSDSADLIYTGNSPQIIYFLTDKESPTPYIHRTMLFQPRLIELMEINCEEEFRRIFEQHPRYVLKEIEEITVWDTSLYNSFLRNYHYNLDTVFDEDEVVEIYELQKTI